jgi:hypothetical protein
MTKFLLIGILLIACEQTTAPTGYNIPLIVDYDPAGSGYSTACKIEYRNELLGVLLMDEQDTIMCPADTVQIVYTKNGSKQVRRVYSIQSRVYRIN